MYCYLVKEMQWCQVVGFYVDTGVKVAVAGDYTVKRGDGVGLGLLCQVKEVGKVDHAGGVCLMEGNAAFVNESGHNWNQR